MRTIAFFWQYFKRYKLSFVIVLLMMVTATVFQVLFRFMSVRLFSIWLSWDGLLLRRVRLIRFCQLLAASWAVYWCPLSACLFPA